MEFTEDIFEDLEKITRFEYIDERGRNIVRYLKPDSEKFIISVQDGGRTLKVLLSKRS